MTQKQYNYSTIRITEFYDAVKEGNTVTNCNRFWCVSITDSIGNKTSMRCDSNKEFIQFIKENCHLVKR